MIKRLSSVRLYIFVSYFKSIFQGLKDLIRVTMYLLLMDSLKSAKAKKLLVIHWSSINS